MGFLDRKQVVKFLGIPLVTVHDRSKKGVLKPYKIGNRIRYRREDIIATLERSRES
ncbi:helix-turn-helix domain-containing protein [Arenibacter palladensis]|uniref:helix-turn-helix domain-containing protein n=1 Tax=Arenibacter palladensis TaxID=237373 RepID=UPI003A0FFEBC